MTEQDATSLDVLLAGCARAIATPDPVSFAAAVAGRLRSHQPVIPPPRPARWRRDRRWMVAIAAGVVALCAVVALTVPPVRSAVADLLGVDGVHITRGAPLPVPTTPPASGSRTSTPPADPVGALHLGTLTTLQEAARLVGFPLRLPTAGGYQQPDAVLVGSPPPGGMASMVYLAKPGRPAAQAGGVAALLSEFRGHLEAGFFQKLAGNGTNVEAVRVGGAEGFWLSGSPHEFFYVRPDGTVDTETIRLAGNTLLWSVAGITYRFESALSKDGAIAAAESIR
jgi:hypothetical protein